MDKHDHSNSCCFFYLLKKNFHYNKMHPLHPPVKNSLTEVLRNPLIGNYVVTTERVDKYRPPAVG